ncbi:MAG: amidohydrolase family protein [Alistipes sp.]|nr:amidohydrolase family protein [Alistipes sp.]
MISVHSLRRIASHRLLLPDSTLLPSPLVTVDGDGCILAVESVSDVDRREGVEFYPGLLVPGFVNAHCHLELSHLGGFVPRRCGFAGFARAMGAARGRFTDEERSMAAAAAAAAMWHEGVAAVGDISNGPASFAVKAASPLRFRNWVELFGLGVRDAEALRPLLDRPNASLTPHSVYSVQDAPFRAICAAGREPLSIHFMESAGEAELFAGRGELAEWYAAQGWTCDFLGYGMPSERIVESVPADRSVVLVHDCHVTQPDIDIIMSHFSAPVWWCLCPRSNDFISGVRPPVELLRRNGLNICIGTDSMASNDSLSMLEEVRALSDMPLAEALVAATLGGAQALGFDDLGAVEPGRRPGLAVVSGVDFDTMTLRDTAAARRVV